MVHIDILAYSDEVTPFIREVYEYNQTNPEIVSKSKADSSAFTIADGIIQHLIVNVLFLGNHRDNVFRAIVGEEDNVVQLTTKPYTVDEILLPSQLDQIINTTEASVKKLSAQVNNLSARYSEAYKQLTLFVDPIDGTKAFKRGAGECCSIVIGFARDSRAVGGIVYRPLGETHHSTSFPRLQQN